MQLIASTGGRRLVQIYTIKTPPNINHPKLPCKYGRYYLEYCGWFYVYLVLTIHHHCIIMIMLHTVVTLQYYK